MVLMYLKSTLPYDLNHYISDIDRHYSFKSTNFLININIQPYWLMSTALILKLVPYQQGPCR